jgi:hypothetical protein
MTIFSKKKETIFILEQGFMYEGQINASEFTMERGSLQRFYTG